MAPLITSPVNDSPRKRYSTSTGCFTAAVGAKDYPILTRTGKDALDYPVYVVASRRRHVHQYWMGLFRIIYFRCDQKKKGKTEMEGTKGKKAQLAAHNVTLLSLKYFTGKRIIQAMNKYS